ncbi:MAG: CpsB/CapC family capsule biosynthesis tyrosine phosphatase [Paraglaciecola sp.]|uniref:tyrosine-protein phosphatase n=1 Tax=Paraglaciecola sp. TaxID=1920173 RepID=UPI003298A0F7
MIDIHSHILPGVDDGAQNINEALDMLRMAVEQGVTTQVLTPHIHMGRFDNTYSELKEQFFRFRDIVSSANIPIKILLAAELRVGPELIQLIEREQMPWIGKHKGKKTFLLEFPRTEIPYGSDNLVRWLTQKSIVPIIVHPERNKTFLRNRKKLQTFIDLGCPLQITASSLVGKFGPDVQKMAAQLLINGDVSFIASDCHNLKGRAPDLVNGYYQAKSILGEASAKNLTETAALGLIKHNDFQSL